MRPAEGESFELGGDDQDSPHDGDQAAEEERLDCVGDQSPFRGQPTAPRFLPRPPSSSHAVALAEVSEVDGDDQEESDE